MSSNSLAAEQYIIGVMLAFPSTCADCLTELDALDFDDLSNRYIFEQFQAIYDNNLTINLENLMGQLKEKNLFKGIGGLQYLRKCKFFAASASDLSFYTKKLKECRQVRDLKLLIQNVEPQLADPIDDATKFIDDLVERILRLQYRKEEGDEFEFGGFLRGEQGEISGDIINHLEELKERNCQLKPGEHVMTGIPSGYLDLDNLTLGYNPGTINIIAGRPSMGKTTFALNIARNICLESKINVAFISYEMKLNEVWPKILSACTEVKENNIRTGQLDPQDIYKVKEAQFKFKDAKFHIRFPNSRNAKHLRAICRSLVRQHNVKVIIIDYLQLLKYMPPERKFIDKQNEISEISSLLKEIARDLHISIICLSQLSRETEKRTSNVPIMSDLRESGAIEQDADTITMLYRPEKYDERVKPGYAEALLVKNRIGPTGIVKLAFQGQYSRFCNFSEDSLNDE